MKMVYEAAHGVEAHMIADLLRQEGIAGLVQGEYLQGAIGALPACGLVRVVVDEADYERARKVIDGWVAAQPRDEEAAAPPSAQSTTQWSWFAAGLLLGAFATYVAGLTAPGRAAADAALCRASS